MKDLYFFSIILHMYKYWITIWFRNDLSTYHQHSSSISADRTLLSQTNAKKGVKYTQNLKQNQEELSSGDRPPPISKPAQLKWLLGWSLKRINLIFQIHNVSSFLALYSTN